MESYKKWCVKKLMAISAKLENHQEKAAIEYVIGFLIGMGWYDEEE